MSSLIIFEQSSKRPTLIAAEREELRALAGLLGQSVGSHYGRGLSPANAFAQAALDLRVLELELTERILTAHADGYSTTTRDLINELVPF